MDTVRVRRDDLLQEIKENRDRHRETFLKAQEVYRVKMIEELDRMIADARNGGRILRGFALVEPEDHTRDYDRVISMLEMSVDDTVELDERQASMYVMDEWGWTGSFRASTAAYVGTN